MKRFRPDVLLVVLGIVAIAAISVLGYETSASIPPPSTYSSNDTGPNGYRALYNVLQAHGVAVSRSERQLDLLSPTVNTLVISSVLPELDSVNALAVRPITRRDLPLLKAFMRRGGRLVVLATDIGGPGDAQLGLPAVRAVATAAYVSPVARVALTAGVARVRAHVTVAFPFATRKGVPLLATPQGIVAMTYPYGKGEMVAISAPNVFSNANLARDDNARFAVNVLGTRGPVAFDERVHGYVVDKSFWAALPASVHAAVWVVLALLILAAIGANVPFAPPPSLEEPDERDSSHYLDAVASLLARARAARTAVADFADDAMRRARRRYGLPPQADVSAVVRRVDRAEVREGIAALDRLRSLSSPDDAALVRAAAVNARLRKELG